MKRSFLLKPEKFFKKSFLVLMEGVEPQKPDEAKKSKNPLKVFVGGFQNGFSSGLMLTHVLTADTS